MKMKKSQDDYHKVLYVRIDSKLDKAVGWEVERTKKEWGGTISRMAVVRRILWKHMVDNGYLG